MNSSKVLLGTFGLILKLLEKNDGVEAEAISQLAVELYEDAVGKYRPVLQAIPHVADRVASDLVPVIESIQRVVTKVRSDPAVVEAMNQSNKIKAEQRYQAMIAYKDAGFTRAEAFALVMQDAANAKAILSGYNLPSSKSVGNLPSSKKE